MPRIFARLTGKHLGDLDEQDYARLILLLADTADASNPSPIDPAALARLAESGASEQLLAVARQLLEDGGDVEVEWEPDPD